MGVPKFVTGSGNNPRRIGYCGGRKDGLALSCIYIVFQEKCTPSVSAESLRECRVGEIRGGQVCMGEAWL